MIYFDNNATTPMAPEVQARFRELIDNFGNPSSVHGVGRAARKTLNESREKIAEILDVSESSLTFTSGGTEALNQVLIGLFLPQPEGAHLVVSAVEHHAVLATADFLASLGVEVSRVPVDSQGRLDPEQVAGHLKPETRLVAVMWANNETGNIYPVQAIGERCRERGVPLLCDGVQAVGKLPLHLKEASIDYLAASAHKFHGPKGVGLLYSREGLEPAPLIRGGRQERGHRAGTENLPGIGAMARALELVEEEREVQVKRIAELRDRLQQGILELIPRAQVLGDSEHRLPGTLNVHLPGVSGELALVQLDRAGVAISIGAACESGSVDPSHVLLAMGLDEEAAASGLRFSLARDNTPEEVETVLKIMADVIKPLVN